MCFAACVDHVQCFPLIMALTQKVQKEVFVIAREKHFYSTRGDRKRPTAFLTSHTDSSTICTYDAAGYFMKKSLGVNLAGRFENIIECPDAAVEGSLDLVIDYSRKVCVFL